MPTLSDKITDLMTSIRTDQQVFEKFEIDSSYAGKYQKIEGNSKIFDYWYDRFCEIKDKAEAIERMASFLKEEMQKVFTNCHQCFMTLADRLTQFTYYNISQARADIDFINNKVEIIILYKTIDSADPEDSDDYLQFQKEIYKVQEEFNEKFSPLNFSIKNLFWDTSLSIECIIRDFPICIRK